MVRLRLFTVFALIVLGLFVGIGVQAQEMTATLAITTDTSAVMAPTPQSQVQSQPQALPSTGGEMSEGVSIALILILLGMIFCLTGALVMQMKRES